MKKGIMILLTMILLLAACSSKKSDANEEVANEDLDNLNESGMPIVEKPITLNFFAGKTAQSADDWNDVLVFNTYEDMTNIKINWEMVPSESLNEKKNLRLASGDLPDAFHTVGMSNEDLMKYGEQGVFISLNELIEDYAPNLNKILEEYPNIKKGLTMPDGNIYSFPTIESPDFLSVRMAAKPYINEEWLDKLDMDMPETTEEFYEYLKEVKSTDLNGNGKDDEIPYGAPSIDDLLSWIKGSFGISNKGFQNPYFDLDPKEDKMRFYPTSDEYKEMLQYVNKLFKEGLIEQNIFSIDLNQYLANAADGLYGSTNWYSPVDIFGKESGGVFTGAPALEGPHGDKLYIGLRDPLVSRAPFTITNQNEHPAATVRWMDHFYGDEGAKLFFMGVEGETYEETPDGDVEYVDKIRNSPEGLTFEQEASKYLTWPGGGAPGIFKKEYFKGAESSEQELEAAERLKPDTIEEAWPSFTYTKEESGDLASFGSDIEKYVDEMQDKFISGDAAFSEWDNYVKTIEKMGLDKYMEIQEKAYERYQNN
jgi:putative aldouronate transport system substrate-binding protein